MPRPNLIVYHKNCIDGRLSFAVASQWHSRKKIGFVGKPIYPGDKVLLHGKYADIYFLDLAPTQEQYNELSTNHKVFVIDHHIANKAKLVTDSPYVSFDISKCGCVLTWEFFFPDKDIPIILEYAQDYDLWKFEKKQTHNVNLALQSLDNTDCRWDKYLYETDAFPLFISDGIAKLKIMGQTISSFRDKQVERIVRTAKFFTQDDGIPFAVVYSQCFCNMVAESICNNINNKAEYVVILSGCGKMSFRSSSYDVEKIASRLGGGGHKTSAGAINVEAYNDYLEKLKIT